MGSAVIKLGGSNNSDYPLYTETVHQANARAAGLLVHHYWANGQVGTPEQIADAVMRTGQVLPGEKIALDIESWPNEAREWNPTEAATVADALHDRGIPYSDIPVYLSQSLLRKYDWAPVVERGMPLWLAAWDEGPALVEDFDDVWLRQYTSSSNAELRKLYPGDLDLNRAPDDVWTVKQLQTALGVEADGYYGPITTAAVRNHQAANGLYADGIAGPLTLATLRKGGA